MEPSSRGFYGCMLKPSPFWKSKQKMMKEETNFEAVEKDLNK
jgi:hypothetical protein